jgi:hypothetical protein
MGPDIFLIEPESRLGASQWRSGIRPGGRTRTAPGFDHEEDLGVGTVGIDEDRSVEQPGGRLGVTVDRMRQWPQGVFLRLDIVFFLSFANRLSPRQRRNPRKKNR